MDEIFGVKCCPVLISKYETQWFHFDPLNIFQETDFYPFTKLNPRPSCTMTQANVCTGGFGGVVLNNSVANSVTGLPEPQDTKLPSIHR